MSLGNQPVKDRDPVTLTPAFVEVTVPTASAIVTLRHNPYIILIGDSAEHPRPVIPGGKIDLADLRRNAANPALACVLREVREETGARLLNPHCIGTAQDPNRDVRILPASVLAGTLASRDLPADILPEALVKAHHGCPDFIFTGTVDERALRSTEELTGLRFVDMRSLGPWDLAAGHDLIVNAFLEMLDRKLNALRRGALTDFALERAHWASR